LGEGYKEKNTLSEQSPACCLLRTGFGKNRSGDQPSASASGDYMEKKKITTWIRFFIYIFVPLLSSYGNVYTLSTQLATCPLRERWCQLKPSRRKKKKKAVYGVGRVLAKRRGLL
jgi:hypothetical protein